VRATALPTGTVTFLFTDIEGSTQLLKRLRGRYGEVLVEQRRILRAAVREHGGEEVDTQGDSFLFAFRRADGGARAAVDAQRALAAQEWPDGAELRVRMGIHTAEPSASDEGYYGLGVHRAARIMGAAHGGQILVSLAASSVLEDAELDGAHLRDLGEYWLKDLDRPERLYQLEAAGLQKTFPSVAGQRPASVVEPALDDAGEPLLERDDATSALAESLGDVARTRRGRLVSVTGEAGVGKTSLLRRFCAEQHDAPRLIWGACDPLFTPRPLGPLVDVAEATGGELLHVVDEGAKPQAVAAALIRELAVRGPTVLVLEDLHWADEATLDVIALLGRKIETVPALAVLTYRDDELDRRHPLRIVLGAFARARALRRVDLTPLSRDALARLAEPRGIDADELYRRTGGNPFFATEALAAGDAEVPATVREAVLARAASLSPQAEALLEAAAVAPPHVPLWLLEALTEDDLDALDECLTSGMLVHGVEGVAFRHELARLAVEDSLSPTRRLALHRRALPALAEPPTGSPDLERLAHHAEGAGDAVAALRYAPAAGDRAARVGAHREAAAQYGRALRFAASLGPHERAELLHKYSYECYLTDQQQEAFDALERAAAAFREIGDTRGEGDSLLRLADILWCPGRTADADETARRAITILEQVEPGRELAMAYAVLAALRKDALDTENAIAYASRAHALAERVDDTGTRIRALRTIAMAEVLAGQLDGLDKLEQNLAVSEAAERPNNVAGAFIYLLQAAALLRSYDIADRYLEGALTYTGERGHILSESYLHAFGAKIALDRGRWDEADELCTLVFQKRLTSIFPRVLALTVRALVGARRGGEAEADSLLDEALELAQPSGEVMRIAPVALAQAEVAWLAGDRDGIMAATDRVFGDALEQGGPWPLPELAFWRWRAGLDAPPLPDPEHPYALQIAGAWARAAERWTAIGCPYEAALALADADAEEPLRRALAELERLGAEAAAARVESRSQRHRTNLAPDERDRVAAESRMKHSLPGGD
jgi:class 3 adenylate cyclase/tetratricopeptide (TPR) repeat protein